MHNPAPTLIRPLLRLARSARLIAPLIVAVAVVAGITTACSSSTASSPPHAAGRAHSAGVPSRLSRRCWCAGISGWTRPGGSRCARAGGSH